MFTSRAIPDLSFSTVQNPQEKPWEAIEHLPRVYGDYMYLCA